MSGGRHTRSTVGVSYRRQHAQRSRRPWWILLCCALAFGALAALFIVRGLDIHTLHRQLAQSHVAYEQAWVDRVDLESRLASKDNLSAIEDAARQLLGWVMPGEERVIFVNREGEVSGGGE